jgi:hypothetical protein
MLVDVDIQISLTDKFHKLAERLKSCESISEVQGMQPALAIIKQQTLPAMTEVFSVLQQLLRRSNDFGLL